MQRIDSPFHTVVGLILATATTTDYTVTEARQSAREYADTLGDTPAARAIFAHPGDARLFLVGAWDINLGRIVVLYDANYAAQAMYYSITPA